VHRAQLCDQDVTVHDGIPVTTPARTLVDLADVVPRRALERAFDEAEYLRLDCTGLAPIAGRPGYGRLGRVLAGHRAGSTRTRSELEELFLELCARHGLPRPDVNVILEGHEVDFLWPKERLVVEVDGRGAHLTRRAFEQDRARDAELTVAGWRVLRLTGERLEAEPDRVAAQVGSLVNAAGVSARAGAGASEANARAKASITLGSNWVPAQARSSSSAASSDMRPR
jgi:very-short-patch-repair endonuclease